MRLRKIAAVAAVVSLLLALLTWLLVRSLSTDSADYAATLRLFDELALAQASLHRDVLEARAGLLQNYDPLNASLVNIDSVVERLRLKASDEGLDVAPVDRLAGAVRTLEELTERFKTDNALLRNSLSVLRLLGLQAAITRIVEANQGRIANTAGDAMLVEFSSSVAALDSALAIQKVVGPLNRGVGGDDEMLLRIGVNVGEVIVEGGDVFGEVVNVASRLEAIAEPGGVCVSHACYAQTKRQFTVNFVDLGEQRLKNIVEPVRACAVRPLWVDRVSRAVSPQSTVTADLAARTASNHNTSAAGPTDESEDQRQANSAAILPWPGRRRASEPRA